MFLSNTAAGPCRSPQSRRGRRFDRVPGTSARGIHLFFPPAMLYGRECVEGLRQITVISVQEGQGWITPGAHDNFPACSAGSVGTTFSEMGNA